MDNQSIIEQLGGEPQISKLIDQFYYRILTDKSMRDFFLDADMSRIRFQQKCYFSSMFGGTTPYHGKDLIQTHTNLGISDQQFDTFKSHLKTILLDLKKDPSVIDLVLAKVESHRPVIVIPNLFHKIINQYLSFVQRCQSYESAPKIEKQSQ